MNIGSETAVGDIAAEYPASIAVLERLGIDFCCGGKTSLANACARHDLDLESVLAELSHKQHNVNDADRQWQQAPLKDLAEYIVRKHHAFTREQLKLIGDLMIKVERRHGADHPEVFEIGKVIAVIGSELTHHSYCEENTLFPYIAHLENSQSTAPHAVFGSVETPITRMMMEHDQAGEELRTLRTLTNNYTPPAVVCSTWRALYRALEEFEQDLHRHIHLENNILFPRTMALAKIKE
jgi:regulator of cell morphogenesis and NO signaling